MAKKAAKSRVSKRRVNSSLESRGVSQKPNSLMLSAAAISGIAGGILFLSPSLTGNVAGNPTEITANLIGIALFVFGLIAGFMLIKNKRS